MEEFRIDCLHQTEEELGVAKELRQNIFRLNHTMPDTEEYRELLHKVFPHLGENCRIETPFAGVRTANVKFGRNVIVMPGCLMMSAGLDWSRGHRPARSYHRRECGGRSRQCRHARCGAEYPCRGQSRQIYSQDKIMIG